MTIGRNSLVRASARIKIKDRGKCGQVISVVYKGNVKFLQIQWNGEKEISSTDYLPNEVTEIKSESSKEVKSQLYNVVKNEKQKEERVLEKALSFENVPLILNEADRILVTENLDLYNSIYQAKRERKKIYPLTVHSSESEILLMKINERSLRERTLNTLKVEVLCGKDGCFKSNKDYEVGCTIQSTDNLTGRKYSFKEGKRARDEGAVEGGRRTMYDDSDINYNSEEQRIADLPPMG
jgi:hypothetical protein